MSVQLNMNSYGLLQNSKQEVAFPRYKPDKCLK